MAPARSPAAALLLCGLGLRSAAALPTPTADPSAAAGGPAAGSAAAAAGGHGILFLFSDEMDGRIHDPASPQTKPPMPNLQKLAASGALFTTACEQQPRYVPVAQSGSGCTAVCAAAPFPPSASPQRSGCAQTRSRRSACPRARR